MISFARFCSRRLIVALAVSVSCTLVVPASALAQQGQQQGLVQQFNANPQQILQQFPNGGAAMISQLREVAIADPKSLDAIMGLIPNASKDQKAAIGSALGQAAKVVVKTDQAYANDILQAIAKTKDQDVFLAYSGVAPDQGTAATGGGGAGGGGGGVGGQSNALAGTPSSTGAPQAIGGGNTPTANFSYTSSVSGGGTTSGTTTLLATGTSQ
ncbi:hypothetical protein [Bradyrhizobium symbiodeficiens]|uniref:hypothetical protein n=1 Tax=Bradyrhizobium symbiodeficiens TaxID=1404367 RepID=UPI00140FC602|nr:hypothetical protein [Bradyrhizobium symbiodeficiens]QIO98789.1 hypothetical protein HAU86_02725 [Bradyrhizobium symbiodeficiens]